jgi:predicted nuclease of predicted toxin-antitoxin system
MRFLLDEDVNPAVAEIGAGLGLEVLSIHEIGRRGLSDEEQLRFAAFEDRILVTRNRDDFLRLCVLFFHASESHPGVLIIPRSLPNDQPARIAHALKRWDERQGLAGTSFVDFLSA